jgi:hypothetical protein
MLHVATFLSTLDFQWTNILTARLTNSQEKIPSAEANISSVKKDFPRLLWYPEDYYGVRKNPPFATYPEPYESSPCPFISFAEDIF